MKVRSYAGWRRGLCENARIIFDYSAKPRAFGFEYPVKRLDYCTRSAILTTSGPRPSRLCQECDAATAQEMRGRLFSHTPDVAVDATGTRIDERGRLTLNEAWERVGSR